MLLYVINQNLEVIGICEDVISVIWTNRYYDCGDFEIYAPATDQYIDLFERGNYVVREGKETNAMIVESVQIQTDAESGNKIIISGRCLKSILTRRIIWQQTNLNGQIEYCISRLLQENIINPQDNDRKISNFVFNQTGNFTNTLSIQYTGDNLHEAIVGICQRYGIGYDITLDLDNQQFIFSLYAGADRSYNQDVNPFVVFSNDFENLLSTNYIEDATNYKNVAKVAGEGEGIARKYATVGTASGLDRYELYIDSRNTSTNDGEISAEDYETILENEGEEELANYIIIEDFEGEVETGRNYTYETDFFLGDIVELVNEYGMEANARIIEVIESEDETGKHTIPTFSNNS